MQNHDARDYTLQELRNDHQKSSDAYHYWHARVAQALDDYDPKDKGSRAELTQTVLALVKAGDILSEH
jgi:hypothetical protein